MLPTLGKGGMGDAADVEQGRGGGNSAARSKLRTTIQVVSSLPDPFLKAQQMRKDHWRPLKLRFSRGELHSTGRPRMPHARDATTLDAIRLHVPKAQRTNERYLKMRDARIELPKNIGKWLVDPDNLAPDPYATRHQQILYSARISVRFKDHILSEGPCAYALACPFPFMICSYMYDLWRVYTCQGCSRGVVSFDQPALWVRKQYDKRAYVHVYNNRIEANYPVVRFPWGVLGCGSWNQDRVMVHYFDRGSFGFRQVPCGTRYHCCCAWEPFGEVGGRQRCPCNGPLIERNGSVHCGQWWCDSWLCTMCCCHFHYPGMVDAQEFAVASEVALQSYFRGHWYTKEEFDEALDLELAVRHLPKKRGPFRFDVDKYSYSRTMAAIAIIFGLLTIALQIGVALGLAMYIQWSAHKQWYESYWQVVSRPESYPEFASNTTRVFIAIVPGVSNDDLRNSSSSG